MLLRSVTQHIREQNWFAVLIDLAIVVIGVFIGIQVSNWNDARGARLQETLILQQLSSEYLTIESGLDRQIRVREGYVESLESLVLGLDGHEPMPEPNMIRRALIAARSTGRTAPESAVYLQLTNSDQLARLSNESLKRLLIGYHTLLRRDEIFLPLLAEVAIDEFVANDAVDFDLRGMAISGAAVDAQNYSNTTDASAIRSYDIEALEDRVGRYEWMHMVHRAMVLADPKLLTLTRNITKKLSRTWRGWTK